MSKCKLFFFVGVFPKNIPFKKPTMVPMISIIWKMNWTAGAAPSSESNAAKAMTVNVEHIQGLSGGSQAKDVYYDIYKLHPSIQSKEDAQKVLDNPAFDWQENAIAISLHALEVGLTNDAGTGTACTVSP